MNRELDRLAQLETRLAWVYEYRELARQLDRLKLFPGKFYQSHKTEIDRYRYAVKELKDAGLTEPDDVVGCAAQLERQLKGVEDQIEKQTGELKPLYRELRQRCSCEGYIRNLLGLPEPPNLPKFSQGDKPTQGKPSSTVPVRDTPPETSLQKKLREVHERLERERRDQRPGEAPGQRQESDLER